MGNVNGMTFYRILIYAAPLSIVLVSAAVTAAQTNQQAMTKTTAAAMAAEIDSAAVPLIDRAAPAAYKTATFALG